MASGKQRPPKRVTRERLRNIAMAYVQRYGGSSARLRQVLLRRVDRSLRFHDELARQAEAHAWVEAVVQELRDTGASDDLKNARAQAIEHALLGRPRRAIAQRLRGKGYDATTIEAALCALDSDEVDPDWVACCRFARRRKFGPFRVARSQPRSREQELAALMRAGFGYGLARRVVDAPSIESLEEVIDGAPVPSLYR